jgi:hypothetical protein
MVDYCEVSSFVVYSRCNNGSRTLPSGTPALTGDDSVCSV